ncbi:tyrosine-type recombinase/integrase [Micromonospora robiginosa]|uniref:Tyrosine-type recombinase/integrase n=1 Tax=Micromonospora robiginosa TaxID=2749844 RepID=A0A7L6B5Z9_9ACTN|nr:tyrosine-type recombinase/integrase [Micromonospora ferruginea]QLQ37309.1 tyrosine-type recombinase/integrase [Micromonospora ferruginea]
MSAENEAMAGEHQDEANGSHRRRPLGGHQPHTRCPERPRKDSQEDRQTVDPDSRTVGEKPPACLEIAGVDRHRVRLVRARLSSLTLPSPLSLRFHGLPVNRSSPRSPSPPPLPRFLVEPIAARIAGRSGDELVFTSPAGGVLRNNNFRRRVFDRAAVSVGLAGLTPHELRHTAASLAVAEGANVKAVQRMLGHASAAMTLDVYADLFEDDLDQMADRLDRAAGRAAADSARTAGVGPDLDATGSGRRQHG